jgi:hypothetical protein
MLLFSSGGTGRDKLPLVHSTSHLFPSRFAGERQIQQTQPGSFVKQTKRYESEKA